MNRLLALSALPLCLFACKAYEYHNTPVASAPAPAVSTAAPAATAPPAAVTVHADVAPSDAATGTQVGMAAPDWTLEDIRTNQPVTLSSLRGKWVLLDFWATWCGPCVHAMQTELGPLHQQFGDRDDWQLISIGTSWNNDTAEAQKAFANTNGYNWTFVHDTTGDTATNWGVDGIPTMVLIDPQGVIQARDYHGVGLLLAQRLDPTVTSLAPRRTDIASGATAYRADGPASGNAPQGGDVVYSFTPTETGNHSITTTGNGFDTVLQIYSADGRQLGENDDMGNGSLDSQLVLPLEAGTPVYISVAGYGNAAGAFTLTVMSASEDAARPPNP